MKRIFYIIGWLCISITINAQQEVDVVTGASYLYEVYYSFENGTVRTVPRGEWDIAFTTEPAGTSIMANNGFNIKVYTYPAGDTSHWNNIILDSIANAKPLYNSLQTWQKGAFNRNAAAGDTTDAGWGKLDVENQIIEGDSIYIIEFPDAPYKKLWIEQKNLNENSWTFRYASIDGTNEKQVQFDADEYQNMNFIHYSMRSEELIEHEPDKSTWQLFFNVYFDYNIPYILNGVWSNQDVLVQQVNSVDQETFTDYDETAFSDMTTAIGGDWKTFNNSTMSYEIADDIVYFVQYPSDTTQTDAIWKMYFTGFGGMQNGIYTFMQENLTPDGIADNATREIVVYPNPADDHIIIEHPIKPGTQLFIYDMSGKPVLAESIQSEGIVSYKKFQISHLTAGIYHLVVRSFDSKASARFIKK